MPWSNDQLNEIFIYDPVSGALILSIDSTGFRYTVGDKYYEITAQGILGRLVPDTGQYVALLPVDATDGVRLELQAPPRDGVTPWEQVGRITTEIDEPSPGVVVPLALVSSPATSVAGQSQITLYGESGDGSVDSVIYFYAEFMRGPFDQQLSFGMCDTYLGDSSTNVTAEAIVDSTWGLWFGSGMQSTRYYRADFSGVVSSTVAGNRIRLRVYRAPTSGTLAGATLIQECGEITVSAANIPQPFNVSATFQGVSADQYIALTGQRTLGAGTCNVTTRTRVLTDYSPS